MRLLACLCVVASLGACDDFEMLPDPEGAAPDVPVTPAPVDPDPLTELPLPEGLDAEVTSIVDGDTVHVRLDGRDERVRYIGIDTPETSSNQPYSAEARERNRELVEGQTVRLVVDVQERDRYGRLLAYVYTPDGSFVNAKLVAEGFARLLTVPPNVRFASVFRALETEARDAERNLWQR